MRVCGHEIKPQIRQLKCLLAPLKIKTEFEIFSMRLGIHMLVVLRLFL